MDYDLKKVLARVLVYEGGKVNDPRDPGGKTNQGVTQRTYTAWLRSQGRAVADVYAMPDADRDEIYKGEYWDQVRGDELPLGLDLVLFDGAVNSGPAQSIKWLQACLSGVAVDGVLGTKTLAVVQSYQGDGSINDLIASVCSHRLATLQRLSTWKYFGVGWHARIANVQKTAEAWVDQAPEPHNVDLSNFGGSSKANVSGVKPPMISQVTAHMTTGAAATATIATQTATQVQGLSDTFGWIKYVFGSLTLLSVGAGIVAMFASKAHDAAIAGTATAVVNLDADNQAGMNVTKAVA